MFLQKSSVLDPLEQDRLILSTISEILSELLVMNLHRALEEVYRSLEAADQAVQPHQQCKRVTTGGVTHQM